MVSDPGWYGMGEVTEGVVSKLLPFFPGCRDRQRMLSVVMQGHEIESHVDLQPVEWVTRLHLPLVTNDDAVFVSDGVECHMMVGSVYKVDTTKPHAIINRGKTPRIHFMFDVVRK
jgi:aspartyl/asparaginyl beta-hydroxylase (cupin superfamily)